MLDAVRAVAMFRQLKVPILGLVENMSFFDLACVPHRAGRHPKAKEAATRRATCSTQPGDERVYLFGRGGVKRKAEAMGMPVPGRSPLEHPPA